MPCGFYGVDPGAPVEEGEVLLDRARAKALAGAGAGAARVEFRLDGADGWDEAKLDEYDAIIDAVRAEGIEPLGLLSYRVARGGQADWNDDPDRDGDNEYVQEFARAAEVLMARFAGRVTRWEIWSQPNCYDNPDYADDPGNAGCTYVLPRVLARILGEIRVRNEALFNVDEVALITGGLLVSDDAAAPLSGVDYLRDLYAQPVWDDLEVRYGERFPWSHVGHQLFVQQFSEIDPAALAGYLDEVSEVAEEEGDEASLFVTGTGWAAPLVGEEIQAQNLSTSFSTLSARKDVAGVVWASFQDAPQDSPYDYGLLDETGAPKRALDALRAAAAGCTRDRDGGEGSGGGGSSPSSGGSIGSPPPPSSVGGRPIDGRRRESSCSHAAGWGASPGAGWLTLLVVGSSGLVRSRLGRAGRSRQGR